LKGCSDLVVIIKKLDIWFSFGIYLHNVLMYCIVCRPYSENRKRWLICFLFPNSYICIDNNFQTEGWS